MDESYTAVTMEFTSSKVTDSPRAATSSKNSPTLLQQKAPPSFHWEGLVPRGIVKIGGHRLDVINRGSWGELRFHALPEPTNAPCTPPTSARSPPPAGDRT